MLGQTHPLFNQWENIKQSIITGNNAQYKIRKNLFLGRGGFGIVFGAIKRQKIGTSSTHNYQEVVLKEFKKSERWQSQEDWDKELVVFKKYLNKDNPDFILKVYDIFQEKTSKRYYLAMQYATGGSLHDRIKSPIRQQQIVQFVKKAAQILTFLHYEALQNFKLKDQNSKIEDGLALIHRDFKPANFVLRNKNSISTMCLIDFGITKVGYVNIPMPFNNTGTNNYKAPQISQVRSYNSKVDIYSFGCTLYELFTSGQRLVGTTGIQKKFKDRQIYIKNKLIDLQYRFSRTEKDRKIKYPNFWLQILSKCLAHDPKDRWSSYQLNKFVNEYSPEKYMTGAEFFGGKNEQNKLVRERKEIYEINFQIFRLNLIQQRIYSIFEHLYFNQPRLSKFMLYGVLKYVIIFELQKFYKIKQKCKLLRREDKLLLVKRLFETTKLEEIKKKAIEKMKNELQKERESYRGTASNDHGHIQQMTEKYPELINEVSAQPRRTLYEFCYQERNAIMQDESFAKMIAQILVFMEELDWYNQLRVELRELQSTDAELLSIKKLGKFRQSIQQQLQQDTKKVFEGCHNEVSLKSGMNREQSRTDIALVRK